jgi:hypothetical protein
MKAKDKAEELINKYLNGKDENGWYLTEFESCAIQCALICVDEILKILTFEFDEEDTIVTNWNEVKQEILNRQ